MFHLTKIIIKKMKMKKNLHTSFIKFLLEKYTDETQKLPQQEPEEDEISVPAANRKEKLKKMNEIEDEEEPQDPLPDDDETGVDEIQELLNEYKRLKKRNENNRVYNRRRK